MKFRSSVRQEDIHAVRVLVASTGFFHPPELDIAAELVAESVERGTASSYKFLFADAPAEKYP